MKIALSRSGEAEMEGPAWMNRHNLRRIAALARRCGLEGRYVNNRWRNTARRLGVPLQLVAKDRRQNHEYVIFDDHEWWGHEDGYATDLLDLIQAAGFDTALYSCLATGGGYWAQASDDDGEDIDILAASFGATRTQAAAGLALWAERATRPRKGIPRFGPRRAP